MKKKSLIKSCLLGSALLLGTGYAVINSKDVSITGTVSAANTTLDVYVGNFQSENFDCVQNGETFTLTLKEGKEFKTVGETKSFSFFIGTNIRDYNIAYTINTTLSNPDFYDVSSNFDDTGTIYCDGGGNDFIWNISMTDLPVTVEESECTIIIKITFAAKR